MHLEQLECIIEVAKTGSLTNAARNLHITLSAVSQSISNLEAELGLSLFKRSRQGTVPTAEGEAIIKKAYEIISKVQELRDEANDFSNTQSGELRLATIPGPLSLYLDILIQFKRAYPQIEMEISEKGTQEIIDDIRYNKVDLGLIILFEHLLEKNLHLSFGRLLKGKIVVCVSRKSPLALQRTISPYDLLDQSFVFFNDDYMKWYMDQFQETYGKANILFTTNNQDAIFRALHEENIVTIGLDFSFSKFPQIESEELVMIELDIPRPEPVYLGWVRAEEKRFSKAESIFIQKLSYELQKK
ncbi:LysR family transcriptional regulator [Shimazuella alba]|uniref:LysR family transcriptional regulator n=1 Tax=Shimazuella alba TaxID=2690964 RepID=A0A6I4VT81_9BACL|nr:LysR family transcriptional regulator [Shimazuella alba]MXQ53405.1 LysR family transcriptional regulator [Shimazuella alba]